MTDANVYNSGAGADPSSSLLDRVRASDQAAWERLVHVYSPLVYRWCRRAGLQSADAADVGQQVFLTVARKVRDFRRDRDGDSFRGWLRAITHSRLADLVRTGRYGRAAGGDAQERLGQVPDEPPSADPASEREEEGVLVRRAMELMRAEFEDRTWQAFWQLVIDGRAAADVALALGMTRNAVYLARGRVLRRLREEFADLIDL